MDLFCCLSLGGSLRRVSSVSTIESKTKTQSFANLFGGWWFQPMTVAGIVLTTLSIYYAFAGSHVEFGGRALLVILVALGAAIFSFII